MKGRPVTVEEALHRMGFSYPPDAIAAVREGRSTYHPLRQDVTYRVGPSLTKIIREAILMVEGSGPYPA